MRGKDNQCTQVAETANAFVDYQTPCYSARAETCLNAKNTDISLRHVKVPALVRLGIPVERQASRLAERVARC